MRLGNDAEDGAEFTFCRLHNCPSPRYSHVKTRLQIRHAVHVRLRHGLWPVACGRDIAPYCQRGDPQAVQRKSRRLGTGSAVRDVLLRPTTVAAAEHLQEGWVSLPD